MVYVAEVGCSRCMAYLLEPLQGLGGELVLLGVLLEVCDELGEDALELLERGGHDGGVGGAGQVGVGDGDSLAVRGGEEELAGDRWSEERSREPEEAMRACE